VRHEFIDRYSSISSPVHHVPLSLKLFVTIAILLCTVMVPGSTGVYFIAAFVFLIVVGMLSRIPALFLAKRLLFLEVFVVGVAGLTLLQPNGLEAFANALIRSTICLFAIVLFSNTTRFADLLQSLRRWGIPDLMITILALMYRYIFVLVDEMERMQRARTSRMFVENRWARWKSLSTVIAQSFLRSTERAERIYAAMLARGWK
jgi:cobalt/nickel transport system permease protein